MEKKTLVNILETHDSWILCFLELKSGEVLIGSQDKTIKMYDLDNKTCKLSLEGHEDGVRCLAEMRNGEILSGSADKTIKLWNLKTKTCKLTLKGHNGSVKCLIILMNGNLLSGSTDTSLRLWSLKSKNCILVLKGHVDHLYDTLLFTYDLVKNTFLWIKNSKLSKIVLDYFVRHRVQNKGTAKLFINIIGTIS